MQNPLNTPTPLVLGEETYHIGAFTKGIQEEFKQWLIAGAFQAASKMAENLTDDQYIDVLSKINLQAASHQYSFGSNAFNSALKTIEGASYFLWLLMRNNNKNLALENVTEIITTYPHEIKAAFDEIFKWYLDNATGASKKK